LIIRKEIKNIFFFLGKAREWTLSGLENETAGEELIFDYNLKMTNPLT
jgi:hypothetical protein